MKPPKPTYDDHVNDRLPSGWRSDPAVGRIGERATGLRRRTCNRVFLARIEYNPSLP